MITVTQQPPAFHHAYNPVLFTLHSTEAAGTVRITSGSKSVSFEVDFVDNRATFDAQNALKTFFDDISYSASVVETGNFQSVTYSLFDTTAAQPLLLAGPFTALRSAAQVNQKHDLTPQLGKLLTGFKKLHAYKGYPADVSNLSVAGLWKGKDLPPGRVNRLQINCDDQFIDPAHHISCTANWDKTAFVCQNLEADYAFEVEYETKKAFEWDVLTQIAFIVTSTKNNQSIPWEIKQPFETPDWLHISPSDNGISIWNTQTNTEPYKREFTFTIIQNESENTIDLTVVQFAQPTIQILATRNTNWEEEVVELNCELTDAGNIIGQFPLNTTIPNGQYFIEEEHPFTINNVDKERGIIMTLTLNPGNSNFRFGTIESDDWDIREETDTEITLGTTYLLVEKNNYNIRIQVMGE